MRALVTGGTGFVGRVLVDELLRLGWTVRVTTRDASSQIARGAKRRVVSGLSGDTDWRSALEEIDVVFHLAARVHVMKDSASGAVEFQRVNVDGTRRLAEQAADSGVRRFVYLSSIKVNGEGTEPGHPFTERDVPAPADAYGKSKADAEAALREIAAHTSLEVAIIRPPLVYGPGVKANFASMVNWLRRGIPLPLGSVAHNRRSLVAVDNLVSLMIVCATHAAAPGEVFLVSDGEDLSTKALLQRVARAAGVRARLLPVPSALIRLIATLTGRGGVYQRLCGSLQVDISKARQLLLWTPPVGVDEGLRQVIVGKRERQ